MFLTLIARQPKNLWQKHKTIIIISPQKTHEHKHTACCTCLHRTQEMKACLWSTQITERRRSVQTLTSCVSAQASWPENCPCAKRKRVNNYSEDREERNHRAESLQTSQVWIQSIKIHHVFHFTHNLNKYEYRNMQEAWLV